MILQGFRFSKTSLLAICLFTVSFGASAAPSCTDEVKVKLSNPSTYMRSCNDECTKNHDRTLPHYNYVMGRCMEGCKRAAISAAKIANTVCSEQTANSATKKRMS